MFLTGNIYIQFMFDLFVLTECIKLLLRYGADRTAKTNSGNSSREMASYTSKDVCIVLQEAMRRMTKDADRTGKRMVIINIHFILFYFLICSMLLQIYMLI